jgi:hypothetical protein
LRIKYNLCSKMCLGEFFESMQLVASAGGMLLDFLESNQQDKFLSYYLFLSRIKGKETVFLQKSPSWKN